MAKITRTPSSGQRTITVKTTPDSPIQATQWWKADSKSARAAQVISTATYLKQNQQYRYRQASMYTRLYDGNSPLAGGSMTGMAVGKNLPADRPTMNVIQSCIDTLVSRISQNRPRPVFLTDGGDYVERNLSKKLNNFMVGELFRTKAYELGALALRDASTLGTAAIKVFERDNKVCLERVLITELMVDVADAFYGDPRSLYQFYLIDRSVLQDLFPDKASKIEKAQNAAPDSVSGQTSVADQIMLVEAWHLPSGENAKDGRHVIACSAGDLLDEEYTKPTFPFVFLHSSPRITGFWGQGTAERLMGTQTEINKLLITISKSINLVGVPKVFIPFGSKIPKASFNNEVGGIIEFQGAMPPKYETPPCVAPELYMQLERLVNFAYQQEGISALSAGSKKPEGLNSGAALREYDDLQTDRFAALVRRYDTMFVDLAYKIIDLAKDIQKREGKYTTVYPNKNSAREIDLPKAKILKDTYIIQCYTSSSLPKEPAARLQKVTEMMQAGIVSPSEGRRLLDFPDTEQIDTLANAAEERILKILDEIVEDGKYTMPDPFMDLQLAKTLVVQYYNLYLACGLEEKKAELLRTFSTQIDLMVQQAMSPAPGGLPQSGQPQAVPQAPPVSDMLPVAPAA